MPASDALRQEYPGAQSAADAQPMVQAAPAQACGVQSVVPVLAQFPAPSHLEAPTSVAVPAVHAAATQTVPAG